MLLFLPLQVLSISPDVVVLTMLRHHVVMVVDISRLVSIPVARVRHHQWERDRWTHVVVMVVVITVVVIGNMQAVAGMMEQVRAGIRLGT